MNSPVPGLLAQEKNAVEPFAETRLKSPTSKRQYPRQTGALNGVDQFKDPKTEVILWPTKYKTGDIIYPYTPTK